MSRPGPARRGSAGPLLPARVLIPADPWGCLACPVRARCAGPGTRYRFTVDGATDCYTKPSTGGAWSSAQRLAVASGLVPFLETDDPEGRT